MRAKKSQRRFFIIIIFFFSYSHSVSVFIEQNEPVLADKLERIECQTLTIYTAHRTDKSPLPLREK